MLVSHASCLAAVLTRLEQLTEGDPAAREIMMKLVLSIVGGLEVVGHLKNDLLSGEAAAEASK